MLAIAVQKARPNWLTFFEETHWYPGDIRLIPQATPGTLASMTIYLSKYTYKKS